MQQHATAFRVSCYTKHQASFVTITIIIRTICGGALQGMSLAGEVLRSWHSHWNAFGTNLYYHRLVICYSYLTTLSDHAICHMLSCLPPAIHCNFILVSMNYEYVQKSVDSHVIFLYKIHWDPPEWLANRRIFAWNILHLPSAHCRPLQRKADTPKQNTCGTSKTQRLSKMQTRS